jgi:hypothetical protein
MRVVRCGYSITNTQSTGRANIKSPPGKRLNRQPIAGNRNHSGKIKKTGRQLLAAPRPC